MGLTEIANTLVNDIKSELERRGKVVTSSTLNSVGFDIIEDDELIEINFNWDFVLDIIDKGINGTDVNNGSPYSFSGGNKMIPTDAISGWMRSKGIDDSLKFAIAKSIYQNGYGGEDFLDDVINKYVPVLESKIEQYIQEGIEREINITFGL